MLISVNMKKDSLEEKEIRIFIKHTINSINIELIAYDYWEYIADIFMVMTIYCITYSKNNWKHEI